MVQRVDIALCESQILYRVGDFAVSDQKGSIAGHASDDHLGRFCRPGVVEARHIQTQLSARDHLLHSGIAWSEECVGRKRAKGIGRGQRVSGGGFALLFAGAIRVINHTLGHPVLDQIHTPLGHAFKVERPGETVRAQPIVPDGDALVYDLLADLAGHKAPSFLQRHRAETGPGHHLHKVLDGIGLQDDSVLAGLKGARILAAQTLFHRLPADGLKIQIVHVQRQGRSVAGAGLAHDDRVDIGMGRRIVGKGAQRVSHGHLKDGRSQSPGRDHACIAGHQADGTHPLGPLFRCAASRRLAKGGHLRDRLGTG